MVTNTNKKTITFDGPGDDREIKAPAFRGTNAIEIRSGKPPQGKYTSISHSPLLLKKEVVPMSRKWLTKTVVEAIAFALIAKLVDVMLG